MYSNVEIETIEDPSLMTMDPVEEMVRVFESSQEYAHLTWDSVSDEMISQEFSDYSSSDLAVWYIYTYYCNNRIPFLDFRKYVSEAKYSVTMEQIMELQDVTLTPSGDDSVLKPIYRDVRIEKLCADDPAVAERLYRACELRGLEETDILTASCCSIAIPLWHVKGFDVVKGSHVIEVAKAFCKKYCTDQGQAMLREKYRSILPNIFPSIVPSDWNRAMKINALKNALK